jgi:acetyltransferase-like isoleucine patch superfamily enzyme
MLRGLTGKFCEAIGTHAPSNALRVRCQRARGVRIGAGVYLGVNAIIDPACPELVSIEDHARIGIGVIILAHNRPGDAVLAHVPEERAPVVVKRHAAVQAGAILLPGVTIGEGAIVKPGAVVETDVDPYTMVAGVPARVVGRVPSSPAPLVTGGTKDSP